MGNLFQIYNQESEVLDLRYFFLSFFFFFLIMSNCAAQTDLNSRKSSSLSLPGTGIKGVRYHSLGAGMHEVSIFLESSYPWT